ncbi:MAG: carbamate kinase [Sulfolobales archaeon]|nr:carbamate kinase [Sulfolobales archaeon]MDW8082417.1 carbamate kinase [Sulfolobales archaeon]
MAERDRNLVLIALGGNAFQSREDKGTPEDYWRNAFIAAKTVVRVVRDGYRVVITHGNGPQVGIISEWMENLKHKIPPQTLDIAGAMTQGWLGYLLAQSIQNTLVEEKLVDRVRGVVAIVNRVAVRKDDPAWSNPTKFIGSWYTDASEVEKLSKEKGWTFKKDPRGGWRRVVPSPNPYRNVEAEVVKTLLREGWIVVASGGGGIPVAEELGGRLVGVEAVIDKDLASEVLATELGAAHFVILTDVDGVYVNFGREDKRKLINITASELEEYYKQGHFPPGSMGPKVLAGIRFVRNGGLRAAIGHLHEGYEVIRGTKGTQIVPS